MFARFRFPTVPSIDYFRTKIFGYSLFTPLYYCSNLIMHRCRYRIVSRGQPPVTLSDDYKRGCDEAHGTPPRMLGNAETEASEKQDQCDHWLPSESS